MHNSSSSPAFQNNLHHSNDPTNKMLPAQCYPPKDLGNSSSNDNIIINKPPKTKCKCTSQRVQKRRKIKREKRLAMDDNEILNNATNQCNNISIVSNNILSNISKQSAIAQLIQQNKYGKIRKNSSTK